MESQTIEKALSDLARERQMDVFKSDGRLNRRALADALTTAGGKKVHQSFVQRLIEGELPGKQSTLQKMADGFGLSLNEFLARIRPETAMTRAPALPPEAMELWSLWTKLPRQLRNYYTEQFKSAIKNLQDYPELTAVISGDAQTLANATRVARQRRRSAG